MSDLWRTQTQLYSQYFLLATIRQPTYLFYSTLRRLSDLIPVLGSYISIHAFCRTLKVLHFLDFIWSSITAIRPLYESSHKYSTNSAFVFLSLFLNKFQKWDKGYQDAQWNITSYIESQCKKTLLRVHCLYLGLCTHLQPISQKIYNPFILSFLIRFSSILLCSIVHVAHQHSEWPNSDYHEL